MFIIRKFLSYEYFEGAVLCVFTILLLTYSLLLRETELVFLVTKYLKHISAKMYRETFFLSPLLCELYEDHLDKCGFMFLGRDEEDNIKSHSGNEIQKFHYNREFASKKAKINSFFVVSDKEYRHL